MVERCGVLCQHPGCWYSTEKLYQGHRTQCTGYVEYINYLLSKRKTQAATNGNSKPHVGYEDGLSLLTVSELVPDDLSPALPPPRPLPQRPTTQPFPTEISSSAPAADKRQDSISCTSNSGSMRFSLNTPLYADRGRPPSPPPKEYDEYWFTPVLLWQPGKNGKKAKKQERTADRSLKTTDLTNTLPPVSSSKGQTQSKDKRPLSKANKKSKNFKLSMDQYIMEGLHDVPPDIVEQIIQEMHSHSCSDVHGELMADNPSDELLRPPLASPPRFPSPLIFGASQSFTEDTTVPSSMKLDLQSKKIQRISSMKDRRTKRTPMATLSYSRALAHQPDKALTGLKTRVAQLQAEDHHYYTTTKPFVNNSTPSHVDQQTGNTQGTGLLRSSLLQDTTTPVKTGPSYFTPRSLNKATIQRLNYTSTNKGAVPLSKSRTLGLTVSNAPAFQQIPIRPSIHVPPLPIHDTPFSEELGSYPGSGTWPESRSANSGNISSHQSSDHLIVSADLATQTGELLLMNREGTVIHHVTEMKTPKDSINNKATLELDLGSLTNSQAPPLGSVAPPPTAIKPNQQLSPSIHEATPPQEEPPLGSVAPPPTAMNEPISSSGEEEIEQNHS